MGARIFKQPAINTDALVLTAEPVASLADAAKRAGSEAQEEFSEAKRRAAQLLARAREDAQRVLETARAEADRLYEEARVAGRQAGYEQGHQDGLTTGHEEAARAVHAEAEATVGEYLRQLGVLIDQALVDRVALLRDAEADLVTLALGIAEKVLHQRLANDERSAVLDIARDALERLAAASAESARVRVHPADYETYRDVWEELELHGAGGVACRMMPDERVEPGGCLIEAKAARIDGQWSTQMTQVRGALLGGLGDDAVDSDAETPAP